MIILGIDPGIQKVGWCVLENKCNDIKYINSGTIETKKNNTVPAKLGYINMQIESIFSMFLPDIVAIENVFINKNPKSSIILSYAKGVILGIVGKYNIDIEEIQANTIKKIITGNGKAEKTQVKYMIKALLPTVDPKTFDESDAVAIAYSGIVTKASSHFNLIDNLQSI